VCSEPTDGFTVVGLTHSELPEDPKTPTMAAGPYRPVLTTLRENPCSTEGRGVEAPSSLLAARAARCMRVLAWTVNCGTTTIRSELLVLVMVGKKPIAQ